jgi:hypothetical protein
MKVELIINYVNSETTKEISISGKPSGGKDMNGNDEYSFKFPIMETKGYWDVDKGYVKVQTQIEIPIDQVDKMKHQCRICKGFISDKYTKEANDDFALNGQNVYNRNYCIDCWNYVVEPLNK